MQLPVTQAEPQQPTYATDTPVDFVVIGSGIAGGSVARELTRNGFAVVLLEQGRKVGPDDMEHDELGAFMWPRWTNDPALSPQTYRRDACTDPCHLAV